MRGTLHFVATEDAGWLLGLLGPAFIPANQARRVKLGLDEATCARGLDLIREILSGQGPLSRAELGQRLAGRGLALEGQALPHLIGLAALKGLVCLGPGRGNHASVVLLEDWVRIGPALAREEAHGRSWPGATWRPMARPAWATWRTGRGCRKTRCAPRGTSWPPSGWTLTAPESY